MPLARGTALLAALLLCLASGVEAATLNICVKKVGSRDDDFDAAFRHGPIHLPAGAVFDLGDAGRNGGTGVITLTQVTLTKAKPCAVTEAAAAHSTEWRWTTAPVFGSDRDSYQLYGILHGAALDTSFSDDSDPVDYAAARGLINATLRGTTTRTINVDD